MKDNRINVPEKSEACNNTHHIDKNDSHKWNFAFSLFRFGIKPHKQIFETEMVKKTEELIKEPRFAKTVYFRDIITISKIFCYTGLISIGGCQVRRSAIFCDASLIKLMQLNYHYYQRMSSWLEL